MELLTIILTAAMIAVIILWSELSEAKKHRDSLTKENEQLQGRLSNVHKRRESLTKKNEQLQKKLYEVELGLSLFPIVSEKRYAELRKMDYKEYLETGEWTERAKIMRARFENRCQACNRHKNEVQLEVHHRTYERRGNEKPTDLTVLCQECHQMVHDRHPIHRFY